MYENRIVAYHQLIQQLLECPSKEETQILKKNIQLLDPGLLYTIIEGAKQVDENGNPEVAKFLTNLALELGKLLGSGQQPTAIRKQIADALLTWGIEQFDMSRFLVAFQCWQQCLSIYQAIHDRQGEAYSVGNLGNYYSLEDDERAIAFHKQHLAISLEIEDRQGEAYSLGSLGNAYYSLGDDERAIDFYEQSLAINREIEDRLGEATSLGNLGNYYYCLGDDERAIDFHEQSLAINREIKYRCGEAISLGNLGNAYYSLGQYEKAIENYQDCLEIATLKTMPAECFKVGRNLGNIGFTQGNWQLALEGYEPAIKAVEQLRKGSTTDDRRQKIIAEAISVYANTVR